MSLQGFFCVKFPSSGLTLYDEVPSFEVVAGLEWESVLRLERDWSRSRVEGRGLQLLQVGERAALCMSFVHTIVIKNLDWFWFVFYIHCD